MNMETFWDETYSEASGYDDEMYRTARIVTKDIQNKLGLFFWNNGGKKAVQMFKEAGIKTFDEMKTFSLIGQRINTANLNFIYAIACLGEIEIKELIEVELK